jgi:hypothetical protein
LDLDNPTAVFSGSLLSVNLLSLKKTRHPARYNKNHFRFDEDCARSNPA